MIKNLTPYIGEIKIRFQKNPEYVGKTLLNKVHLDLGFTKLVSRVKPFKDKKGWIPDINKIYLINCYTGGMIRNHSWESHGQNFTLNHSFVSKSGEYIGDLRKGWWYYQNNFKVCEDYPLGVAIKYDNIKNTTFYNTFKYGKANIIGYYGYTHRGGSLFKLGDKLFDPNYIPKKEDFTHDEWEKYQFDFWKSIDSADSEWFKKGLENDGVKGVIPFNKLGDITIENWEQAKQAAINISKYLS
jgi:hypothetical protein